MLFNSLAFAVFLPIVFIVYWAILPKYRWALMLAASYYFYMCWNPKYVVLILFTTVISYVAAILLEKQALKRNKRIIMLATAVLCLGVLFFFKYFNFVSETVASILNIISIKMHPFTIKLMLPVGISFYTFQTLSYVIDVYRGEIHAETHFGYYAAFVSFFPQLVAGPIERTSNLLPQIKANHEFEYNQATYGLKLMAWGFFKKIVIADTLSKYVSIVYDEPKRFSGFALVLATVFFSLQIYCDFSGYSDIAVGTAKLLGINLSTNFKSPYFSQSVKEFWSRWHISLSTWFRDYIYIPLGGNRVGKLKHKYNLLLTFLLSGLWHGASWTFVVWGGIHGGMQAIESVVVPKNKLKSTGLVWWLRVLCIFSFSTVAWVFFIANSVGDAGYVLTHWFAGITTPVSYLKLGFTGLGIDKIDLLCLMPSLILLGVYDYCSLKKDVIVSISTKKEVVRWAIYIFFVIWMIIGIPTNNSSEFIYFQF